MDRLVKKKHHSILIQILVLTTGVILSSSSGWLLYAMEEKAIVNEFRNDVNERAAILYREIVVNFETLNSLTILFNGNTIPDFKQFSHEAKRILSRHSDIQALGCDVCQDRCRVFYAALFVISISSVAGFSGFSHTSVSGDQSRVSPLQRVGFRSLAASYTALRFARISRSSPRCR